MELSINQELLVQGLLNLFVGVAVAILGIYLAAWLIMKILGIQNFQEKIGEGNLAVATLGAAAIISVALIMGNAVDAIFELVGLIAGNISAGNIITVIFYAFVYMSVSLVVGVFVLLLGAKVFTSMTKKIDEIKAIEENNVSAALLLGAVLIVLALMASPGLHASLTGLLPLPELQLDQFPNIN